MDFKKLKKHYSDYKEALDNIEDKNSNAALIIQGSISALELLFPELKESEDERIRKELIKYIRKTTCVNFIGKCSKKEAEKFISWLEKQEEPLDKIAQKARTEKQRVLVTESDGVANIDWDTRSLQDVKLLLEYGLNYIKKLEKQGEQKPVAKYKVGDTIYYSSFGRLVSFVIANIVEDGTDNPMYEDKDGNSVFEKDLVEQKPTVEIKTPEESLGIDSDTYNKIVDECIYGEQKPADKVDPKFHKGDWIIHQGTENIYQVVALVDNKYQLKYGDNYTIQKCADVERCARLWDITKDAKDGDVLCCESGWTCIFKALNNHTNTFSSYCFMDSYKWFCSTGSEGHTLDKAFIKAYNREIYPATKEQRELLFQKMKEAGYEWDAEKKELKKEKVDNLHNYLYGEQNPTWSKEDDYVIERLFCLLHNEQDKYPQQSSEFQELEEIGNKLVSFKDRIQPKQEWSEEDEEALDMCIDAIPKAWKTKSGILLTKWLKKRFYQQSNQKWDKKDSEIMDELIYELNQRPFLGSPYIVKFTDWLKSLKERYIWKPSDEQMKALKDALNDAICQYDFKGSLIKEEVTRKHAEIIESLYNDLKKLK